MMRLFFSLASLLLVSVDGAGVGNFFTYYEQGGLGPERWPFLSIDGNQCGGTNGESGYGQSPVTIDRSVASTTGQSCDTDKSAYKFVGGDCTWNDLDFSISNNGVKVAIKEGKTCSFGQMNIPHTPNKFNALQFHIHTYSEHQIEGKGDNNGFFPAELHVVHQEETKESFAVFGTMISLSPSDTPHEMFDWFLKGLEKVATKVAETCPASKVRRELASTILQQKVTCDAINTYRYPQTNLTFPDEAPNLYNLPTAEQWGVFTYKGGLTTPGCTEIVNWNLLDEPMEISKNQLDRLEYLVLCFAEQIKAADSSVEKCQYATVASESGSTSRPPQPLLGRTVLHRCEGGPAKQIDDVGVQKTPGGGFTKPAPVAEPLNTQSNPKCAGTLREGCSDDKRYNPKVSYNLKANAPAWNDVEGYWVGTKKKYDNQGKPLMETFASQKFKNTLPYPQDEINVFINRTVTQTHFLEHFYKVFRPANKNLFCTFAVPTESANVLGGGKCGDNGYVSLGERFGTASFEKDGVVHLFYANGIYSNAKSGKVMPIDADTFYSATTGDDFEFTDTFGFSNSERTKITGTGQYYIRSNELPYSEHPLAESYTYELHQVDAETFKSELQKAYQANKVLEAEQKGTISRGNCVDVNNCPPQEQFSANDPSYSSSPYQDDSQIKGGWIAFFVLIGVFIMGGFFIWFHYWQINKQADRYKHQFARRVAETIEVDATHDKLLPKHLEEEFKKMDKHGNGVVTKEDLKLFMGSRINDRDFNVMFAAIDLDHNGTIEFSEFVAFMAQIGAVYDEEELKHIQSSGGVTAKKLEISDSTPPNKEANEEESTPPNNEVNQEE